MSQTPSILPLVETVQPADEAAVASLLHDACRSGTAVYPIGGGTSLAYGLRPSRPGIGLSTAMLRRIVDYPARDMTVTVEAGLPLADLNRRLAGQRQWLPIDVPQPDRATVGGIVATNSYGPRRYAYGTIRDYVLGIRAVDGQGQAFSSGGRVVKNAAGYNIPRLLVGSFGTLGVITQVTFMVQPMPQSSAFVGCDLDEFDQVECLLAGLTHTRTLPVAIELMAGESREQSPLPLCPKNSVARLLVGFDGGEAEVQWMVRRLCEEWKAAGGASPWCVDDADGDGLWGWLAEFSGDLQVHVLPSVLVQLVQDLVELVPGASIQAHAGSGVVRVRWPARQPPPDGQSPAPDGQPPATEDAGDETFLAMLRGKLRRRVTAAGGSLVVLSPPNGARLTARDVWGMPVNGADVMRSMLERFDPKGVLNPGRFFFGSDSLGGEA